MFKTLITIILILLMSSIASADQQYDWPLDKSNIAPDDMVHVFYDFEDGASFSTYRQDLKTCEFVDVPSEYSYFGFDQPSYVSKHARAMHIHPFDYYYNPDGSQVDYIWIVNGDKAFAPRSMNKLGQYYPGISAKIIINESADINYLSFLASTGCTLAVTIYDQDGTFIFYEKIYSNIYREGNNSSEFTQFYVHFPDHLIGSIELDGAYNAWHVDDMILGFSDIQPPEPEPTPEPTPPEESLYSWAAERISLLDGAPFNPIGLGYDLVMGEFYTIDEIINGQPMNWDPLNKELSYSPGISDVGAIILAYNQDENIINNLGIDDMADKDFKEWIAYGDQQPGDVAFIDYEADGFYDEVVMFIEPQYDHDTGALEDCIRFLEEDGAHFVDSRYLHALYGIDNGVGVQSFMDVKRLPDSENGKGKSPYPNIPGKFKI